MESIFAARIFTEWFAFGEGVSAWTHRYRCARAGVEGRIARGLEIAVQLQGEWQQSSIRAAARVYVPGDIHSLNHGETYALHDIPAPGGTALQVGFILEPDAIAHGQRVSRLSVESLGRDAELTAFARELAHAPIEARPGLVSQGREALRKYIAQYGKPIEPDGLLMAREELERHFRSPLYLRHVADVAGMHPTTFLRAFSRRFGVTPIQYRLKFRIHHASRLAWLAPHMGAAELAAESGFDDLSYFHRAFRKYRKKTLAQYRSGRD